MSKFFHYCLIASSILTTSSILHASEVSDRIKNDAKYTARADIDNETDNKYRQELRGVDAPDDGQLHDRIRNDRKYTVETDKDSPDKNNYTRYKGEAHDRMKDDRKYTVRTDVHDKTDNKFKQEVTGVSAPKNGELHDKIKDDRKYNMEKARQAKVHEDMQAE